MFVELIDGFIAIANPNVLLWCLIGVLMGTLIGALPGLGPVTGIALLLPLTFHLQQVSAVILLISIYLGSMYGARISAILLNIPGDSAAIVTTFEGYPMTRQGKAGYALILSAIASFVGGVFGFIGLIFLTIPLAKVALAFGPAEYSSLILFTLIATSGLTDKYPLKPIIATMLGLLLSSIGMDSVTGQSRLTFGILELTDGINLAVLGIGVFGLSETLIRIEEGVSKKFNQKLSFYSLFSDMKNILNNIGAMVRGSIAGFIAGILPGAGALLATFMSYAIEKKVSKTPEKFGTGVPQGLSGPEAANNASVGGALIPTFALGIPGSASAAILMGGLMLVGLQPGPLLFQNSGNVVWAIFAGFLIANIFLLILNTLFVPFFAKLVEVAEPYLIPFIAAFCFIGAFVVQNRTFDIFLLIVFGVLGYILRKTDFPLAPFFLAFLLGSLLEKNIREALLTSLGDISIFFTRPVSLIFIILSLGILIIPYLRRFIKRNNN